jgi:hypothetical protein
MLKTRGVPIEVMVELFAFDASHPSQQKEDLYPKTEAL